MANIGSFCIVSFVAICCLTGSVTAGFAPDDTGACSSLCESTFQDYEKNICMRGCRLMSLLAFIHGPVMTLDELKQSCLSACSEAYVTTNASSCAFGCQSELPTVEQRRTSLTQFSNNLEQDLQADPICDIFPLCDTSRRFMDYSSRVFSGLMDGLHQQARVGWISITSYSSSDDNGGRLLVVVQGSPQGFMQPAAESRLNPHDGELNLAVGDRDNIRHSNQEDFESVMGDNSVAGGNLETSESRYYKTDAFGYLSTKTRLSRLTVVLMLLTLLGVFLWFVAGVCFPTESRAPAAPPKLSIYGDLEYLPCYEENQPWLMKDKKLLEGNAPALPLKMQQI